MHLLLVLTVANGYVRLSAQEEMKRIVKYWLIYGHVIRSNQIMVWQCWGDFKNEGTRSSPEHH